jgi:DNA-binding MarR family transcriptional regulator
MKSATPDEAVQLRSLVSAVVRRFALAERADVVCCGLTVAQAATLEALERGGLRLGELAQRLGISPSTLTRNLTRLEADGLVAREADPDDARAARVALTAAGTRAAARVVEQEVAFASSILDRLGSRRREVLGGLVELVGAVREATEECCPGAFDHLMGDLPGSGGSGGKDRGEQCCSRR